MNIKNTLSKILNWYFDKSPLLSDVKIGMGEIQILTSNTFKTNSVVVSDNEYQTINRGVLENALKTNFIKFIKYRAEKFDCDDYSFILCGQLKLMFPGVAFGIIHSKTHAFNFAILDDKSVVVIEPQTNKILTVSEFKQMPEYYPAKLVIL